MSARSPDKPKPPAGTVSDSALALMGFSVCKAAGPLHSLSLTLLLLTFIVGLIGSGRSGMLIPSLVLAGCQVWFAWRLAFDQQVFAAWARLPDEECEAAQRTFDAALGKLLKKSAPPGSNRPMLDRVMGARRLHLLQIAALFGQMLTLLASTVGLLILH